MLISQKPAKARPDLSVPGRAAVPLQRHGESENDPFRGGIPPLSESIDSHEGQNRRSSGWQRCNMTHKEGRTVGMKVQVTVEMEFNKLPDDAARELARELIEARGLNVVRVAIPATKDRVKEFVPKAYAPGWTVKVGDRTYVVWDQAPDHKGRRVDLWVTPVERHSDDATVYRFNGGSVHPYHGDGKPCRPHWDSVGSYAEGTYRRVETPCQHESHKSREAAA